MNNTGITYYKLISAYNGDITKNCGLTGGEIDTNFFNLRSNDIDTIDITEDGKSLVFTRLNKEKIVVEGINAQEFNINVDKTYYDKENGTLVLNINGVEHRVEGFFHEAITHKVYSGYNIIGDGTEEHPLNIRENIKTGFFKSVERFIDMSNGEELPINPCIGDRYLTKENVSDCGLLYNFEAIKELDTILKDECSAWRIPSNKDWAEMLNALELCEEDMTHGGSLSNANYGKIAGAYLKADTFKWIKLYSKTEKDEKENIITPLNNILPESSLDKYLETIVNNNVYEINNDGIYDYYVCKNMWEEYEGDNVTPVSALSIHYEFSALPVGCADYLDNNNVKGFGKNTGFWTIDQDKETDAWVRILQYNKDTVRQQGESIDGFYSLRLVNDNISFIPDVEIINEMPYDIVLMPYVKLDENGIIVEKGKRAWTRQNVTYPSFLQNYHNEKVKALKVLDENGNEVIDSAKYFINYWNGKSWEKYNFSNNDVVIISNGPENIIGEAWQLVNSELHNKRGETENKLTKFINNEITTLTNKVNEEVASLNEGQSVLNNKIDDQVNKIEKSIEDLTNDFNKEVSERISNDESTDNEINTLKETDLSLRNNLTNEINRSTSKDTELGNKITEESKTRSEQIIYLTNEIEGEKINRQAAIESLTSNLDNEILDRQNDVAELNGKLTTESIERKANDIKFHESGLTINIVTGAVIVTEGDELHNIGAKAMDVKIDADFGEFE